MADLIASITKFRQRLDDSQPAFANRLGVSVRAVANYEAGRTPTRKVLWALMMLAGQTKHEDLEQVFREAYRATMRGLMKPTNDEEFAWVRMVLTLLRNKGHVPELSSVGTTLLDATERLVSAASKRRGVTGDLEELKETLDWARRMITPDAEQQLRLLARERSQRTGEPFATAFTEVLLEHPDLYSEYQKTLGAPLALTEAQRSRKAKK